MIKFRYCISQIDQNDRGLIKMTICEFSEGRSGGSYGYCKLVLTDVSSSWYLSLCTNEPSKCPYIQTCPECGVKNSASSVFCSDCGSKLRN